MVEAETKAEQLRIARYNNGAAAIAIPEKLRIEALECAHRLSAVGATITEAVEYYLKHAKPEAGAKTVEETIATFLCAKKLAGRRPEYLRVQRVVLGKFAKTFGKRDIHTVNDGEIAEWLNAQPWTLRTRRNYQNDLRNLFGFAQKHRHCAGNPLSKLEKVTIDEKAPGILTIPQAQSLLEAAESLADGSFIPFIAIGLFAGLRSSELEKLDWSDVSIAERTINVRSHVAKSRARRIVTISANLADWIAPHAELSGRVVPEGQLRYWFKELQRRAGIDPWPKNALRHSFASYHLAEHHNAPKTSLELGHNNPNQLFQSYRELVRPIDAVRYWKLKSRLKDAGIITISTAA